MKVSGPGGKRCWRLFAVPGSLRSVVANECNKAKIDHQRPRPDLSAAWTCPGPREAPGSRTRFHQYPLPSSQEGHTDNDDNDDADDADDDAAAAAADVVVVVVVVVDVDDDDYDGGAAGADDDDDDDDDDD
eukprot:7021774-Pyramimonas_sp.AAC.1